MSSPVPVALVLGAAVLALVVELLRRRHLREKYALIWLVVGASIMIIALFPGLLANVSRALGFAVPANLLFFVGSLVLTVISMQLSLEIGRLEHRTQRLAEEVALLRMDLTAARGASPAADEHRGA